MLGDWLVSAMVGPVERRQLKSPDSFFLPPPQWPPTQPSRAVWLHMTWNKSWHNITLGLHFIIWRYRVLKGESRKERFWNCTNRCFNLSSVSGNFNSSSFSKQKISQEKILFLVYNGFRLFLNVTMKLNRGSALAISLCTPWPLTIHSVTNSFENEIFNSAFECRFLKRYKLTPSSNRMDVELIPSTPRLHLL